MSVLVGATRMSLPYDVLSDIVSGDSGEDGAGMARPAGLGARPLHHRSHRSKSAMRPGLPSHYHNGRVHVTRFRQGRPFAQSVDQPPFACCAIRTNIGAAADDCSFHSFTP